MADATVKPLKRTFKYGQHNLADPGAHMAPDQVRQFYAARFPELSTATIAEDIEGNTIAYEFTRAYGEKG